MTHPLTQLPVQMLRMLLSRFPGVPLVLRSYTFLCRHNYLVDSLFFKMMTPLGACYTNTKAWFQCVVAKAHSMKSKRKNVKIS